MLDKYQKSNLQCGATLIHQQRRQPPLTVIKFFFPAGSSFDPPGKQGLAVLTGELLTTSSKKMDMYQFGRFTEKHGLKVSSSVSRDYTVISFTAINDNLPALYKIIDQVFNQPVFSGKAFERTKTRQLAEIRSRREQTSSFALDEGAQFFYGDHPYGSPLRGHLETVAELKPVDCRKFFEENITLSGLIISTVGEADTGKITTIAENLDLNSEPANRPQKNNFSPNRGRKIFHKQIEQPTHLLFYPAPALTAAEYIPL
ncbi:MAG: M16 family metallopeptidase, partial [bacterium]